LTCFVSASSKLAIFETVNQSAQHAGDFLELAFERVVIRQRQKIATPGQLEQRDAFLHGAAGNSEKNCGSATLAAIDSEARFS
jgi:hypothetical protein